jgi:hypothetical protein
MPERAWPLSPFEKDGFRTGTVRLPLLDFDIVLQRHEWFRYDGLVRSLSAYVSSLPRALKEGLCYLPQDIGGFNMVYSTGIEKGYFMAVQNISPRANAFNQAHEAAAIIFTAGRIREFALYLEQQGYHLPLERFSIHEFGEIGGLVGALSAGFSKNDVVRLMESNNDFEGISFLRRLKLI